MTWKSSLWMSAGVAAVLAALAPAALAAVPGGHLRLAPAANITSPPAATCAFGSAYDDGCAGANQNASFTVAGQYGQPFHLHAAQNGQLWTSDHPWPFNAPAIDYPVAYDKTLVLADWTQTTPPSGCAFEVPGANTGSQFDKATTTGSTLSGATLMLGSVSSGTPHIGQIVAGAGLPTSGANLITVTSGSGTNWTVNNPGNFSAGPETIYLGGARILCTTGDPVTHQATFNGWDFTTKGGGLVYVTGGTLTKLTVLNSHFLNGSNINHPIAFQIGTASGQGVVADLDVENSLFDGGWPTATANWEGAISWQSANDQVTLKYNAFINQPGNLCAIDGTGATVLIAYNYADSINQAGGLTGNHGAYCPIIPADSAALTSLSYLYNVGVWASNATPNGLGVGLGSTTFSALGDTASYSTLGDLDEEGNIVVANNLTNGATSVSQAMMFVTSFKLVTGNVTLKNNWIDPTGALACLNNTGDAAAGNTTLTWWVDDGSAGVNGDSMVEGNILHVSVIGRGAIYPGATFGQRGSSFVSAVVQPYGSGGTTGTGGAGTGGNAATYLLDGSAQHASGTQGMTFNTPLTNLPITDAGGKIGTNLRAGTDIILSGLQWNSGRCDDHH